MIGQEYEKIVDSESSSLTSLSEIVEKNTYSIKMIQVQNMLSVLKKQSGENQSVKMVSAIRGKTFETDHRNWDSSERSILKKLSLKVLD